MTTFKAFAIQHGSNEGNTAKIFHLSMPNASGYPYHIVTVTHKFDVAHTDINRDLFGPIPSTHAELDSLKDEVLHAYTHGYYSHTDTDLIRKMIAVALAETDLSKPICICIHGLNPETRTDTYKLMNWRSNQLGGEMLHINHMMLVLAKYISLTNDWITWQNASPFPWHIAVRWYDGTHRILGGSTVRLDCKSVFYVKQCRQESSPNREEHRWGDSDYNKSGVGDTVSGTVFTVDPSPVC